MDKVIESPPDARMPATAGRRILCCGVIRRGERKATPLRLMRSDGTPVIVRASRPTSNGPRAA